MLALYALTMFVSATLLFLIQPMFARMVLPLLGGSPAVWNTAVVFYQVMLLLGYVYAHATTKWLGLRRQALLHGLVLLLPFLALPIGVPAGWLPPTETSPIPWLLALLFVAVGLPFFVVSISSPLLQAWFAGSGHRHAADPYFLYAAGNIGSMLALLCYPALVEPNLRLAEQSRLWAVGYGLLLLLTLGCAAFVWRGRGETHDADRMTTDDGRRATAAETLRFGRRVRWVLLAFVPSSLMLSVTTYLTTNIATIPLLWIVPLAIYLLTFILVFATRSPLPHWLMVRALPIIVLPLIVVIVAGATSPFSILIPLHLGTFFVVTMVCHGALAADRPSTAYLTEFYLWMSLGGALGGMFNALLAPLLFNTVVEYPLVLALACVLLPVATAGRAEREKRRFGLRPQHLDLLLPTVLGLATAGLVLVVPAALGSGPLALALMFGLPAFICFSFSRRPLRFGLAVAALLLAGTLYPGDQGRTLYAERSFFGIHRVLRDPNERFNMLVHSGTLHGTQSLDPAQRRVPLTYYYPTGPIGQVFAAFDGPTAKQRIAAVGMGVASIACYSRPGQQWTFYEIDPAVEHIARDRRYFTFLEDCTPSANVVLGDARLSLADVPAQHYDLMVLDAYSSDSVPVHLITREALQLYLDKLAPDGVMAFHISNKYLNLEPVLANLARDGGLIALVQHDIGLTREEEAQGKWASEWLVMARSEAALGSLIDDPRWKRVYGQPEQAVWTDDFSSILSVVRWN